MESDCTQIEDALREAESTQMDAARAHAKSCEACRDQLRSWDELSVAAKLLHKDWPVPNFGTASMHRYLLLVPDSIQGSECAAVGASVCRQRLSCC